MTVSPIQKTDMNILYELVGQEDESIGMPNWSAIAFRYRDQEHEVQDEVKLEALDVSMECEERGGNEASPRASAQRRQRSSPHTPSQDQVEGRRTSKRRKKGPGEWWRAFRAALESIPRTFWPEHP